MVLPEGPPENDKNQTNFKFVRVATAKLSVVEKNRLDTIKEHVEHYHISKVFFATLPTLNVDTLRIQRL